jgi:hypothetical protein
MVLKRTNVILKGLGTEETDFLTKFKTLLAWKKLYSTALEQIYLILTVF